MALEIVAIALGIVAIFVSIGAFWLQKKQGKRIAVSVISTVDQIYRRLRARVGVSEDGDEDYAPDDILASEASPKWPKRGQAVTLRLSGYVSSSPMGAIEVRCIVEEPSGKMADKLLNERLGYGRFDLQVVYPREFVSGSTSEPGRYHISWHLDDKWVVEEGDKQVPGSQRLCRVEDSFAVMP